MNDVEVVSAVEKRQRARDNLSRDLRTALDDAEALLRLTADQTGDRIADLRARAAESVARARDGLQRLQSIATDRVGYAASIADEAVHANPWKALGVATVVGILIGALIARK